MVVQIVGFLAGVLTAFAFLPQVVKTWRSRSSGDLSGTMLGAQSAGVTLWIVYGVAINSLPVVFANSVTLVLCLLLVTFKAMSRTEIRRDFTS
jgi:MtN3 and saliva related transmembrane protein